MKDLSIEYSHIYTNDKIGEEQETSVQVVDAIQDKLSKANTSYFLMVLVDDYSYPDPTFEYNTFISWLKEKGVKPDVLFRESQLIVLCDEVLNHMTNKKLYKQTINYIKNNKYPCSLFIASWYLLRLGYLESVLFDKKYYAKKLISVLPKRFKPFEDRALEIIATTDFAVAEEAIEHFYIEDYISKNNL